MRGEVGETILDDFEMIIDGILGLKVFQGAVLKECKLIFFNLKDIFYTFYSSKVICLF